MMQQLAPRLIARGLAKPDLMVIDGRPANQQHVVVSLLNALLKLVAEIAGHGRDDGLGGEERGFKFRALAWPDLELGDFEDHGCRFSRGLMPTLTGAALQRREGHIHC